MSIIGVLLRRTVIVSSVARKAGLITPSRTTRPTRFNEVSKLEHRTHDLTEKAPQETLMADVAGEWLPGSRYSDT